MNISINGKETIVDTKIEPITLSILVEQLGYHPQLIIIEFNGKILEAKKWNDQLVQEGDKLEIVTIVGGGS
tara:strand:+ start:405 stop:617 length:213 start_codon:yes stop_codon:yes gene_type:complete